MGSTLPKFHDYSNGFAPDLTSTGQRDWITLHAELSLLSIVEVERCWQRFQQLGCDVSGVINVSDLKRDSKLKVCLALHLSRFLATVLLLKTAQTI